MSPAVGWTEHDYYNALWAARRAWERLDPQLTISGLDEGGDMWSLSICAPSLVEPAFSPLSTAEGGLDSQACDGPDASSSLGTRRGQKGA